MRASRPAAGSLRVRLTAIATLVVAVVLSGSALGLVVLQRSQLTANLDNSLEQRADAVLAAVINIEETGIIANSNEEDRAAQLVAANGSVLAATANLAGKPPLPNPLEGGELQSFRTERDLPLEDDSYRVLTRRLVGDVNSTAGEGVLHIAENSDDLNDTIRGLTLALAGAIPIVVGLLAAMIWWLVGRALQSVEAIRSEVAVISGTDLHRRVSVPTHDDEISRLATTMNEMLDRIASSAEQQQRFVADASHELRTPVTRIRTQVEVNINQPDMAHPEATYRLVLDETIALQRLIEDLLHLARSEASEVRLQPQPLDFDDIVLREVRRRSAETNVSIDISSVSAAHLNGDADQLTRVVRNLLSNAIRHAEASVTLDLSEHDGQVEFTVSDDGPGVPAEAQERVFDRFARLDDARTRSDGGSGLGLAIVRDIVERHEGSVRYDNSWSGGARFIILLPAAR